MNFNKEVLFFVRVLILTPIFPPYTGGAATYFSILTKELVKNENIQHLVILTERSLDARLYETKNKLSIYRLLPRRLTLCNKNILFRAFTLLITLFIFSLILVTLQIFFKFKLIHVHFSGFRRLPFLFVIKLLNIFFGSKTIIDVRDLYTHKLKDWYGDYFLFCSKNIQMKYSGQLKKKKSELIPVPIDNEEIKKLIGEEDSKIRNLSYNNIVFVGTLSKNKRIDLLIKAFKVFKNSCAYNYEKLLIVGKNNGLSKLKNEKDVIYLGSQSYENVIKIIKNAKLLVLPSRTEGLPRVCLEALQVGTKIIFPNYVQEFMEYCPQFSFFGDDADILAKKMEDVINKKCGCFYPIDMHRGREVIKKIFKIYEQLIVESVRKA